MRSESMPPRIKKSRRKSARVFCECRLRAASRRCCQAVSPKRAGPSASYRLSTLPVLRTAGEAAADLIAASKRFKSAAQRTACRGRRLDAPGKVGGEDLRRQLDAAVYAQLLVQAFHVGMDGATRQAECPGDLPVALVGQDAPGNLHLARRESKLAGYSRPSLLTEGAIPIRASGYSSVPCPARFAPTSQLPTLLPCRWHPDSPR